MITFVDQNKSLVNKIKKAVKYFPKKIVVQCGNIFDEDGVIVSASNPDFTMGGGLDRLIKKHYPKECSRIVKKQGNQRIGNVIFTITVGKELKSNRELIASALKFALQNTKDNENVLISGLGCGIGGLDEDDFVWLFLQAISEFYGYGWGIKFVNKNGTSLYNDARKKKYTIGKEVTQKDAKNDGAECGVGLHLGKSFIGAGNYNLPEKILFCIFNKENLCGEGDDKYRVGRLLVLCELPRWLGYGINGKKILAKIDKKFNPENYNPYQATKLPSIEQIKNTNLNQVGNQVWNQVRDQVWNQVWNQVGNQVGDQVGNQVGDQVWNQVWNQVGDQVWNQVWNQVGDQVRDQVGDQVWHQVGDQVGDQVRDQMGNQVWHQVWDQVRDQVWNQVWTQVGDQVWNQVGDQVWNQVRATSYWAVNIHFDLGIKHWFGDLLKLGVMIIFMQGKVKIFGKKGKYLGEYDQRDL